LIRIECCADPASALADYGQVPIAFEVTGIFEVAQMAGDTPLLTERKLAISYVKDYDAIPGNAPADWPGRFDVSCWGVFKAWLVDKHIGGAVVALKSPVDPATLWDLRVSPDSRGQGVGRALFSAAEEWARAEGGSELIVETQNINIGACRFYEKQGCELIGIDRNAYRLFPKEIQLIWRKALPPIAAAGLGSKPILC
jgi:GNAT superfamily N-acetyltransferase